MVLFYGACYVAKVIAMSLSVAFAEHLQSDRSRMFVIIMKRLIKCIKTYSNNDC